MIRILALCALVSGCALVYDFDDVSGLPCGPDNGCGRGYSCLTEDGTTGLCVLAGTRSLEETCSRNAHCGEGLLCDNATCWEGQDNCQRLCRLGCDPSNLLSCNSSSQLCFPAREEGAQGQGFCQQGDCQSTNDCDAGDICVRDADRAKGTGVCTQGCDMLDSSSCGENRACVFWFGDISQAACDQAGDLPIGAACNSGDGRSCVPGSICGDNLCVQLCDPESQRGEACAAPNPTCLQIGGMNLGYCTGLCDPMQPGQCGSTADGQQYGCHPANNTVWNCGSDGFGCVCSATCDPSNAEAGTCGLATPCASHANCPDGMLCSSTAACRPSCSLTQQNIECAPQPGTPNPTCRQMGNNPSFGVCE